MIDVVKNLGTLYDDLAKLQADAKTGGFADSHPVPIFLTWV